jgi:phosphopantetheinyl transferase
MPLYKAFKEGEHPETAIWKITEPEAFFSDQLGFSSDRKLEKRRLEHLAARFLLQHLSPDFPFSKMEISQPGKPFVPDSSLHFSISHSFPYVAAAIDQQPVGIDIQVFQEKISRLKDKFLSPTEQELFENKAEQLTLAWTAKEAAFKWFGLGAVDFIRHMPIRKFRLEQQYANLEMEFLRTETATLLPLKGGLEADFAWAVTRF